MSKELIVNGQGPVSFAAAPDRDEWPHEARIQVGLTTVAIAWRKKDGDREAFTALADAYAANDENAFVMIHWDARNDDDNETEWIKGTSEAFEATPYNEL